MSGIKEGRRQEHRGSVVGDFDRNLLPTHPIASRARRLKGDRGGCEERRGIRGPEDWVYTS